MYKNIIVLGDDIAAVSFIHWLRKLDNRSRLTLFTASSRPGPLRCLLPLVSVGSLEPDRACPYTREYIERIALADTRMVGGFGEIAVEDGHVQVGGERLEYTHLVISTGTVPYSRLRGSIHLARVEDAILLREVLEDASDPRIEVYGDLYGIWPAEVFSREGFQTTLLVSDESFFLEHFDEDMWQIIQRKSNFKFRIKHVSSASSYRRAIRVVYGFEEPHLPLIRMRLDVDGHINVDNHMRAGDNVFALGGVAKAPDFLGYAFTSILDDVGILQAITAVLSLFERPPSSLSRVFSSRMGDVYVVSCGYTRRKAAEAGIDATSTRLRMPVGDFLRGYGEAGDIIVKIVVDRQSNRVIGFQIAGPLCVAYLGTLSYWLVLSGETTDRLLTLPNFYIPGGFFWLNPVVKSLYSIWRKTLR